MYRKACSVYSGHLAEVLKETWTDKQTLDMSIRIIAEVYNLPWKRELSYNPKIFKWNSTSEVAEHSECKQLWIGHVTILVFFLISLTQVMINDIIKKPPTVKTP